MSKSILKETYKNCILAIQRSKKILVGKNSTRVFWRLLLLKKTDLYLIVVTIEEFCCIICPSLFSLKSRETGSSVMNKKDQSGSKDGRQPLINTSWCNEYSKWIRVLDMSIRNVFEWLVGLWKTAQTIWEENSINYPNNGCWVRATRDCDVMWRMEESGMSNNGRRNSKENRT